MLQVIGGSISRQERHPYKRLMEEAQAYAALQVRPDVLSHHVWTLLGHNLTGTAYQRYEAYGA